jgi:gamma-glutamylcyclotransferase (GGCT)/AIG2-like uncharacterized protein YtfP
MTLYFAYGSNMSRPLMRLHAPNAKAIDTARLEHHRFIITSDGYASIVPARGQIVHGVLWRLTIRDVASLNAYESVDSGFYRRVRLNVSCAARREAALVYLARTRTIGQPRPGYLDVVVAAAADWDLPAPYIQTLRRFSPTRWRGARVPDMGEVG